MTAKVVTTEYECFAGFVVPARGACTRCAAKPGQRCQWSVKIRRLRQEAERIKRIADRAEARRSAAVYTASATPSSRKSSGARS
jgi:hypothetical protein